jgi:chemotaxis signal transduction protein
MVPVTDLRTPGDDAGAKARPGPLVVLHGDHVESQAAVVVDAVEGIIDIRAEEFRVPVERTRRANAWVHAIVETDMGKISLLDAQTIMADSHVDLTAMAPDETLI